MPSLDEIASTNQLGTRIDFVALNTERAYAILRRSWPAEGTAHPHSSRRSPGRWGASPRGPSDSNPASTVDDYDVANRQPGAASSVTMHALLLHWHGHPLDAPHEPWTWCTSCSAFDAFSSINSSSSAHLAAPGALHPWTAAHIRERRLAAPVLAYDRRLSLDRRHDNQVRFYVEQTTCEATPNAWSAKGCFYNACDLTPRTANSVCRGAKKAHYCRDMRQRCDQMMGS